MLEAPSILYVGILYMLLSPFFERVKAGKIKQRRATKNAQPSGPVVAAIWPT